MGIMDTLQSKQSVYLDSNIFIYLLEMHPTFIDVLTELFLFIDSGQLPAVTSELTLAETLVKPTEENNVDLQRTYQSVLQTSNVLQIISINRVILIEAARLRATNKIKLPDAIHLATAIVNHCQAFITNDLLLKNTNNIRIISLSDFAVKEKLSKL